MIMVLMTAGLVQHHHGQINVEAQAADVFEEQENVCVRVCRLTRRRAPSALQNLHTDLEVLAQGIWIQICVLTMRQMSLDVKWPQGINIKLRLSEDRQLNRCWIPVCPTQRLLKCSFCATTFTPLAGCGAALFGHRALSVSVGA